MSDIFQKIKSKNPLLFNLLTSGKEITGEITKYLSPEDIKNLSEVTLVSPQKYKILSKYVREARNQLLPTKILSNGKMIDELSNLIRNNNLDIFDIVKILKNKKQPFTLSIEDQDIIKKAIDDGMLIPNELWLLLWNDHDTSKNLFEYYLKNRNLKPIINNLNNKEILLGIALNSKIFTEILLERNENIFKKALASTKISDFIENLFQIDDTILIKLYPLFIERLDTNKERTNFLQNLIKNIDKKLIDIEKILEDIEEYFVGISEYRMEDLARYQIFQMMNYLKEFDLIKRLIFDINVFLNSLPEQWKRNELVGNIEENLMRIDAIIDQIDQYTNEDV
jgi:hypothetical protein